MVFHRTQNPPGVKMLLLEPIPDTTGYMIAGYAVAFIVMGLYVASLYVRNRNFEQEITLLEELDKSAATVQPVPAQKTGKRGAKPGTKIKRK
jgi:hypothetical protein